MFVSDTCFERVLTSVNQENEKIGLLYPTCHKLVRCNFSVVFSVLQSVWEAICVVFSSVASLWAILLLCCIIHNVYGTGVCVFVLLSVAVLPWIGRCVAVL